MALKLIGAVGVKVRPEAEDFRDEAERQLRRQLKDGYDIPAEIKPEIDRDKLKQELEKHKQQMRRDLEGMTKNLQISVPEVQSGKFTQSTQKILKEHKKLHRELEDVTKKSVEIRRKAEASFYETSFASTSGLKGRKAILAAAEEFRQAAEQVSNAWDKTDQASARAIRRYVSTLNQARDALGQVHDRQQVINDANFKKPERALRQLAHEGDQVTTIYESVAKAVREVGIKGAAKKLNIDTNLLKAWKDVQLFRHEWDQIPEKGRKALAVKLQMEDNTAMEKIEENLQGLRDRLQGMSATEVRESLAQMRRTGSKYLDEFEREWQGRLDRAKRVNQKWERQSSVDTGLEYEDAQVFKEIQKQIDKLNKSVKDFSVGDLRRQMKALSQDLTEQEVKDISRLSRASGLAEEELQQQLMDRKKILKQIYADEWQNRRRSMLNSGYLQTPGNISQDWQDKLSPSDSDWHRIKREYEQNSKAIIHDSFGQEIKNVPLWLKRHAGDALAEMRDRARIEAGVWAKENIDTQAIENRRIEAEFERHNRALQAEANKTRGAWDGLKFGMDSYRAKIAGVVQDLARKVDARIPMNIDFDPTGNGRMQSRFKDALDKIRHQFHQAVEDMDGAEAEIKPTLDDSSYRIAWAQLKWLSRDRIAMIHVKVNSASAKVAEQVLRSAYNLSGGRAGVDFIKDLGKYVRDLDKHVPAIGAIGTAAVAAFGGVTALVGSVAHLANELVRMSGAALALPGILGGFAVGIGVMIVALKDFGRQMPEITSDLSDLAREIESNFWQEARTPMLDAWNKAFPHFKRGVEETATSLGKWTAAFSKAFGRHFDMGAFDKMFGNLNKSIDIASLGLDDFVKSMSILGQTGSEYLPRLAMWANDVTAGFADWVENAQKTGKLNEYIDTGIQKLKEFGVIVREAGELVYILGSAAERAGFSGLGEMARGLEDFNEKLKTVEGQQVLDHLFDGAARVADGFKRAGSAVGDFVWNSSDLIKHLSTVVGDMIGDTFEDFFQAFQRPEFTKGLMDFFDGISSGVGKLSDSAPAIADVAGALGTLAGAVADNLGDVIGSIFEALADVPPETIEDLADAIDQLGDGLSAMVDGLGEAGIITSALNLLGDAAMFAGGALEFMGRSLEIFSSDKSWEGKGKDAMTLFDDLIEADIPWISWAMQINKDIAIAGGTILAALKNFDTMVEPALRDLVGGWTEKLIGNREIGEQMVHWLLNPFEALGRIGGNISDHIENAKAIIRSKWDEFTGWLSDLFSGNSSAGDLAENQGTTSLLNGFNIDGMGEEFQRKIDLARDWISSKWAEFKSWLGGLFGGGEGESRFEIVMDIIMGAIDNASGVISGVVNFAGDWVANRWQGVLTALDNARTTITRVKDQALNWARGKYQGILTALDNARTTITSVKNQALNWARGKYRGVLTALDNAKGTIATAKSKAQNFASGKYQAVLRALDNASSIVSGVQRKINALKGKTVNIVTNMITKVKKIFSADGNFMPEVKKFADGGIEKHVAQIAPAGAMRVWAEPETGGEAYIPLAKSKRTRSEQILATVADKFGMRLERYANGSDPSGSRQINAPSGDTYNLEFNNVPMNHSEEVASELMFNLKHLKRGGGAGAFA
ncbi:hypothetical protein ACU4IU_00125 [Brevibacterium sp. CSND-B09]|uniref:hypothetical protein n=1 Tax=Brevibacterium sp. CSND-B09 TaxID=3462571 RepID=UPI00406A2D27